MSTFKRVFITCIIFALVATVLAPIILSVFLSIIVVVFKQKAVSFELFWINMQDIAWIASKNLLVVVVICLVSAVLAAITGFYFGFMYERMRFLWLLVSTYFMGALISIIAIAGVLLVQFGIPLGYRNFMDMLQITLAGASIGFICSVIISLIFIPLHCKGKL